MTITWNLGTIRTKVRSLTGRLSSNQMTDSEIDDYIDNYYRNVLPLQTQSTELENLSTGFTGSTVAGTGEYALGSDVFSIKKPLLLANEEIPLWYDIKQFLRIWPESDTTQSEPIHGCLFERKLWLRPIPDDVYTFKAPKLDRPTALSADGDEPVDQLYGPLIAYGAAIDIQMDNGEVEEAQSKAPMLKSYTNIIFRKNVASETGRRAIPNF